MYETLMPAMLEAMEQTEKTCTRNVIVVLPDAWLSSSSTCQGASNRQSDMAAMSTKTREIETVQSASH
jgi:hypothetical protein